MDRVQHTDLESVNDRMRLATGYLDRNPDTERGWMPYFGGLLSCPAPHYSHGPWDACDTGWRMVEAYLLTRQVLGQGEPGAAEQRLRDFVATTLRADGLSWRPDTPWYDSEAWMWDHGRALIALATWLRLEPTDEVAEIARRMAEGLAGLAVEDADGWHYPAENWCGSAWGDTVFAHPPTGLAIEGLVELAGLLEDTRLLDWAGRFVAAVRRRLPPLFDDDGAMVPKGGGPYDFWFTHVHSRLGILLGIAKYALAVDDPDLLAWCRRAYLHARDHLCSTFGWAPESLESGTDPGVRDLSTKRRDEVCSISDMMQLAALFAEHGYAEERDALYRFGVNQLFTHQLVGVAPFRHLMGDGPRPPDTEQTSYRGMPERCFGGFTSGAYPNDLAVDLRSFGLPAQTIDVAGCCSAAGIKALHVLWRQALGRQDGAAVVRLWVTAANADLDVRCDEPAGGRLRITARRAWTSVVVAVPEWLSPAAVVVSPPARARGRMLDLGPMAAEQEVVLRYPLTTRRDVERVADKQYEVDWRGDRVVAVGPATSGCPPYWWRRSDATEAENG